MESSLSNAAMAGRLEDGNVINNVDGLAVPFGIHDAGLGRPGSFD
jgi:hypothetical protein